MKRTCVGWKKGCIDRVRVIMQMMFRVLFHSMTVGMNVSVVMVDWVVEEDEVRGTVMMRMFVSSAEKLTIGRDIVKKVVKTKTESS